MNLNQYHLEENYRKIFDNLSDEDKIKKAFDYCRNSYSLSTFEFLDQVFTYYELKDYPLHKILALEKFESPNFVYMYATDVIKGRWPEAENIIKTSPEYAYFYAANVIKDRWKEAEEIIKTSPIWSYGYAQYVIKDRWPEAENFIKTHSEYACLYAKYLMKERWPEAEETIKKNAIWWSLYETHFNLDG